MKKAIYGTFLAGTLAVLAVVFYYYNEVRFLADDLVYYKPKLTTVILDRNSKPIANIFEREHRRYVKYDDIPPRIVEAIIAIEDTLFFEHNGLNYEAIMRALMKDILAGKKVEGASTLTQQLVKNTLLTSDKKISRKIKEALLALQIEKRLSKEQIMERYLNELYLGHGYYGIKTAAQGYFHKELHELSLKEVGILVGLPKAPSFYDPTRNYEISLGRANRVITRMNTLGWIDNNAMQNALQERPIVYDETRTKNRAPYVVDEVMRQLSDISDLKTGGYTIRTTIDLQMQELAQDSVVLAYEEAIQRSITKLKYFAGRQRIYIDNEGNKTRLNPDDVNRSNFDELNGAMVVTQSATGDVLALVGGVDFEKSAFNRATQALRQPGSAFKPFIYQVGLDFGYSPSTPLADVARTYEFEVQGEVQKWQPKNYEKNFSGVMNLREALVHSRNLATINLVTDIGLKTMQKELQERYEIQNLPKDLSLALGSISVSPMEFAGYFTAFSNGGVMNKSRLITAIEHDTFDTRYFDVISKQTTKPQQAFLMTDIMREVVNRGTGRAAAVSGIEIAGKTGTTNRSVDAWFCGYSPTIQAVVWFGNDNNEPMQPGETGGRVAGPAFAHFFSEYKKLHPEMPTSFEVPEGVITVRKSGKKEYYTTDSPPPQREPVDIPQAQEELLF